MLTFPKLSRYSECGGIAALLPRGHNAGMTAWRSGWQHVSARPLRWILLLALAARLTGLALFPHYFDLGREQGIITHDIYARNLLETGVYGYERGVADAELPPLYSVFLALLYATVGRGYWQLGLAQSFLELISIAALYDIARRLWPQGAGLLKASNSGTCIAALAALCYAVYPYLIFQSLTMIDTALYIAGVYALLWVVVRLNAAHGALVCWLGLAGGLLLWLLLLLRPNIIVLLPFVALWLAIRWGWLGSLRRLAPLVLLSAIFLLPWLAFGASVYGRPVFIALHGGGNFLQGNNPCTVAFLRAGYDTSWMSLDADVPKGESANLVEEDSALLRAGLDYLAQNPGAIPELLWVKFFVYWGVDIWPPQNPPTAENFATLEAVCPGQGLAIGAVSEEDPLRIYDEAPEAGTFRLLHRWYFGPLLLLAILGVALSWREWRQVSLLWGVQLSMTLVYVAFHPATRYRAPTDPLLFVFSAIALCWLWERGRSVFAR